MWEVSNMQKTEQKTEQQAGLGMSFCEEEGRITVFRKTLEALEWPSHYRFLYCLRCNLFHHRRSGIPLSERTGRVCSKIQSYRRSDSADCHSCLFCIRRQCAHDAVLLCGSTGLYPRMQSGGGTGQSGCQVPRWYQLRDLSVPHGNLSCT